MNNFVPEPPKWLFLSFYTLLHVKETISQLKSTGKSHYRWMRVANEKCRFNQICQKKSSLITMFLPSHLAKLFKPKVDLPSYRIESSLEINGESKRKLDDDLALPDKFKSVPYCTEEEDGAVMNKIKANRGKGSEEFWWDRRLFGRGFSFFLLSAELVSFFFPLILSFHLSLYFDDGNKP